MQQDEIHLKLETALKKLKTRYQIALILKYYQELSQIEASEIMGINIRTFESLLARARKKLKKVLIESDLKGEDLL